MLHLAVARKCEAVIKTILARDGVDVSATDHLGQTPLHLAVEQGCDVVVKTLLTQDRVDVNAMDQSSWTPLHRAAQEGHEALVEALLARSAEVDASNISNRKPLYYAASNGHEAVARLLLGEGADPNMCLLNEWDGPMKQLMSEKLWEHSKTAVKSEGHSSTDSLADSASHDEESIHRGHEHSPAINVFPDVKLYGPLEGKTSFRKYGGSVTIAESKIRNRNSNRIVSRRIGSICIVRKARRRKALTAN